MLSSSSRLRVVAVIFALILIALSSTLTSYSRADSQEPVYAHQGAYIWYVVLGASIAFFDGVAGNITYTVTNVFANNSMRVQVLANISEGSEVPESYQILNYTDNIFEPKIFPAVPLSNLSNNSNVFFQNVTCHFVKYQSVTLDPGRFNTSEYQGVDKNGTQYTYYFDRNTGVAVQMSSTAGAAIQLEGSNIVIPDAPPNSISQSLPFYEDFAAAFSVSALIFGAVWWYYRGKNRKLAAANMNYKN